MVTQHTHIHTYIHTYEKELASFALVRHCVYHEPVSRWMFALTIYVYKNWRKIVPLHSFKTACGAVIILLVVMFDIQKSIELVIIHDEEICSLRGMICIQI
jgi:predicted membrane protein